MGHSPAIVLTHSPCCSCSPADVPVVQNTNPNRWASAGAFYPFSRNHFSYNSRPHEYYRWPDVAAAAKKAFTLRYQLLTYMYGSMYLAHAKGGTMARALLFTDPSDAGARWVVGALLVPCFFF